MTNKLTVAAYRNHVGGHQIQIAKTDENGRGHGYRLAGSKHYNQGTTELVSADLDERDVAEVRAMLDEVFPDPARVELATLRRIIAQHITAATILGDKADARSAAMALSEQLDIHGIDLAAPAAAAQEG